MELGKREFETSAEGWTTAAGDRDTGARRFLNSSVGVVSGYTAAAEELDLDFELAVAVELDYFVAAGVSNRSAHSSKVVDNSELDAVGDYFHTTVAVAVSCEKYESYHDYHDHDLAEIAGADRTAEVLELIGDDHCDKQDKYSSYD